MLLDEWQTVAADQTVFLQYLIWLYSVCSGLSVPVIWVNTELHFLFFYQNIFYGYPCELLQWGESGDRELVKEESVMIMISSSLYTVNSHYLRLQWTKNFILR